MRRASRNVMIQFAVSMGVAVGTVAASAWGAVALPRAIKQGKPAKAAFFGAGLGAFSCYLALVAVTVPTTGQPLAAQADSIVVLGAGLVGERPSRALAYRLDRAVELWQQRPTIPIVVSGGQGPDEVIPEAEAMERYLRAKGVPAQFIIQEDQATTTIENLHLSRALLQPQGRSRPAVVTNNFHTLRTSRLAERIWPGARVQGARTTWWYLPYATAREAAALVTQDPRSRAIALAATGLGATLAAGAAWGRRRYQNAPTK